MAYSRSIRKGLLVAGALLAADSAVGELFMFIGLRPLETVGNLLLVEVGVLAIAGGLVEFSQSKGVYEFRRVALQSKNEFSTAKHAEASRKAVLFFSTAVVLFLALIILALLRWK